ncbi:MAG TPA: DUF2007 domain-containing protein [Thermoleophilia bacterium]|nr:DUF2007 domain-containing protein [Thermoleophilia bacterium]
MTRVVAQTPDPVLAALWLGVLERAGIPAFLADQQITSVYPGGILGGVRIVVNDEDADEARRLLDEARAEAESGDDEDIPGS